MKQLVKPRQDFLDVFAELARLTFRHISTQIWHSSVGQHQQIQCFALYGSHRSSESTSLRICVQHALTRFVEGTIIFLDDDHYHFSHSLTREYLLDTQQPYCLEENDKVKAHQLLYRIAHFSFAILIV